MWFVSHAVKWPIDKNNLMNDNGTRLNKTGLMAFAAAVVLTLIVQYYYQVTSMRHLHTN